MNPPLTSVHQDPREQIQAMVRTLMSLLTGEQVRPGTKILPVSIAHRGSA
jgi:DNA-binding LacI/PurR family transcriptional regulator